MKNVMRFISTALLFSGIIALTVLAVPTLFGAEAFTATIVVKRHDPKGLVHADVERFMQRADGSWVREIVLAAGQKGTARVLYDATSKRRISIETETKSTTTYPVSRPAPTACPPGAASAGQRLGFDVVRRTMQSGEVSLESYHAPKLGCLSMLERAERTTADGQKLVNLIEVVSIELGEPDPAAFTIPAGFVERQPSEVFQERSRLRGEECPACMERTGQVLDEAYRSSKAKGQLPE
jgi:hypothetical protein